MRAGLIPSRALQERRIIVERQQKEKTDEDTISKNTSKIFTPFSPFDVNSPLISKINSPTYFFLKTLFIFFLIMLTRCFFLTNVAKCLQLTSLLDVLESLIIFSSQLAFMNGEGTRRSRK